MWEMLCGNVMYNEKSGKTVGLVTMDAEINTVIYVELYSGAKMVDDKYLKTNNVRSINRDSTVFSILAPFQFFGCEII
jgi:hypothetical protein